MHGALSLAVNERGEPFAAWVDNRHDPVLGRWRHIFGAVGSTIVEMGDLNLDRQLTIADVVLELNAVFLQLSFPAPYTAADGNCDSSLSPADIVLLLRAVFLDESFPC